MSQRTRKLLLSLTAVVGANWACVQAQQSAPPLPPPPPSSPMRAVPVPGGRLTVPVAAPAQTPATNSAALPPALQTTNSNGPKIQFASLIYDFGKVKSGDPVKFSYTFTNTGQQTLEVTGVQPQCGCTVAGEWTKKVEPGETGQVPLQFNTANYHGQVFKTVTVTCNDSMQPHVLLQLKGNIWKPIDLVPPYTVMNILPEMPGASVTVKIVNNMEQPLEVMSPESASKGFTAELTTNQPGKEFQLTIKTVPPLSPGAVSSKITVKTSSTNNPTLDIPFWANVQAAVLVMPPQIVIPAGPLFAKVSPTVTIQNNSTNALQVTDTTVNIPGVQPQLKELQPGRIFSVQLTFPDGYEVKPGEQPVLAFKTSHPRFAEVKVPIVQLARPMPSNTNLTTMRPASAHAQSAATRVPAAGSPSGVGVPASAGEPAATVAH